LQGSNTSQLKPDSLFLLREEQLKQQMKETEKPSTFICNWMRERLTWRLI